MNLRKKTILLTAISVVVLILVIGLVSRNKKDEPIERNEEIANVITNTPTPTNIIITETPEPTTDVVNHDGQSKSMLTGMWIDEEIASKRPFAVMLNNHTYASPQSGIGDADILYEALVEGGITRLMGIFEGIKDDSLTGKRIGSVRSARHYFASFADEYDAIFIHFGETTYATKKMKQLGIDHITGSYGIGVDAFYRDKSLKAPHNAFASSTGLNKAITNGTIRSTYEEGYQSHFSFYEEDTELISTEDAKEVILEYSNYTHPYFVYDEEQKVYMRYQFKKPHVDANTSEQLAFKNLIIQYVKEWDIDKNGYQTMDLEDANGEGIYITNGKAVQITWKKNEKTRFMRYYDIEGNELCLNQGKTYIAIFPSSKKENIIMN